MKFKDIFKAFRGQRVIFEQESGFLMPSEIRAVQAYNKIAAATRGINIISDFASPVELNVYEKSNQHYLKTDAKKVEYYLDFPNPHQNKLDFWIQHYVYLLLYGTNFIVLENDGFYNLFPPLVEVVPDSKKFIKAIHFGIGSGRVTYSADEVSIIRLQSADSSYLGTSVLEKLKTEINLINKMLAFHSNLLKTGGIHKFAFRTENILSQKIKDKIREEWVKFHSFASETPGVPPILEGGLALEKINISMDDLEYNNSISRLEHSILINLGIPPALISGDKNTDIEKLLRIFYLTTIIPLIEKTCWGLTKLVNQQSGWFRLGRRTVYIRPVLNTIPALREDIAKLSKLAQSAYVSGIITKNEARVTLNYPEDPDPEANEYMEPANIAGSNLNPSQGGRPSKDEEDD